MKGFWREFLSADNSQVHSGIFFAGVGSLVGFVAFCFYAFWLQKDIGANLVALLTLLTTGGATAGTLAGRFLTPGPPIPPPPNPPKVGG